MVPPRTAATLLCMHGRVRDVGRLLGLAFLYVVFARFGLSLAAVSGFATLVWPPTGISIAAWLLFGTGVWPGIFVGAFVATFVDRVVVERVAGCIIVHQIRNLFAERNRRQGQVVDRLILREQTNFRLVHARHTAAQANR